MKALGLITIGILAYGFYVVWAKDGTPLELFMMGLALMVTVVSLALNWKYLK